MDSIEALKTLLAARGIDPSGAVETGLPAVQALAGDRSWILDPALASARRLAREGIDPRDFLAHGVPAAAGVCGDREPAFRACLDGLVELARFLLERELESWSPFYFAVPSLARASGASEKAFLSLLKDLRDFLQAMRDRDLDPILAVQKGVPAAARGAADRPEAMEASLRFAAALAREGADPAEALLRTVPALLSIAEGHPGVFGDLLESLRVFIVSVSRAGLHPGLPLNEALRAAAEACAGRPEEFPAALPPLLGLIEEMLRRGLEAYPALEYGLSNAARRFAGRPARFLEAVALARALADRGMEPCFLLREGLAFFADAPDESWARVLGFAHSLAREGADPTHVLRFTLPALWEGREVPEDAAERDLDALHALALKLRAARIDPVRAFRWGIPAVREAAPDPAAAFPRALRVADLLAGFGIDPGFALELGFPTVYALGAGQEEIVEPALAAAETLAGLGIDPAPTLRFGFPEILESCGGDAGEFRRMLSDLTDLVADLHRGGTDSGEVLYHDIRSFASLERMRSEAFHRLLAGLRMLIEAVKASGLDPAGTLREGIPAAARASAGRPWVLETALEKGRDLARKALDPLPFLKHGIPGLAAFFPEGEEPLRSRIGELAAFCGETRPGPVLEALAEYGTPAAARVSGARTDAFPRTLRALAGEAETYAGDGGDPADLGRAFAPLAELAGEDAQAFGVLVAHARRRLGELRRALPDLHAFLVHGLPAAVSACGGRLLEFPSLLDRLASAVRALEADGTGSGTVLRHGSETAAILAKGRPGLFLEVLGDLAALARAFRDRRDELGEVLERGLRVAWAVSKGEARAFRAAMTEVGAHFAQPGPEGAGAVRPSDLSALVPFLSAFPSAWKGLVLPALKAHGRAAAPVLRTVGRIASFVKEEADLAVLREIATRQGVRAWDLLDHLVLEGLQAGAISSLAAERDLLRRFLATFPFSDAGFYRAFKEIQAETALGPAQREEKTEALRAELDRLVEAVRAGEADAEQARSPAFPLVLCHLFPPAVTVDRRIVRELFDRMADHPEHLHRWDPGPLQNRVFAFRSGAYRLREGAAIDPAPWEALRRIVEESRSAPLADAAAADLGREAMEAWGRRELAREPARKDVLARAYARFRAAGRELPASLETAEALLAYKEFLEDGLRDVLQEALDAWRASDPDAYERVLRERLAPPVKAGKGLVKEAWKTLEAFHEGALDAASASARLARQLREFAAAGESLLSLLSPAGSAAELEALLGKLSRGEAEIEPGKEVRRILADLCGAEAAAMHRELFGDAAAPAKVEYRIADGGPSLELRVELTKRKAHAAIGFCEGVCTATDVRLWDRPDFLQAVFWGPGGTAMGGMHLLIVEEEGRKFLSLPGVNPSMRLLALAEPEKVLDACLDHAQALARRWGLAGVWIPAGEWIHSNRAAIRKAIGDRGFPRKTVSEQVFSYSPYAYSFREVLVAWEA